MILNRIKPENPRLLSIYDFQLFVGISQPGINACINNMIIKTGGDPLSIEILAKNIRSMEEVDELTFSAELLNIKTLDANLFQKIKDGLVSQILGTGCVSVADVYTSTSSASCASASSTSSARCVTTGSQNAAD